MDFKDHKETDWGLGEQRNIVIATVKNMGTVGTQKESLEVLWKGSDII